MQRRENVLYRSLGDMRRWKIAFRYLELVNNLRRKTEIITNLRSSTSYSTLTADRVLARLERVL